MKKMAKRLKFVAVLLLALVTVLGTVFASSAESAGAKESASASNDDIVVVWADSDDSTSGIAVAASKDQSSSEEGMAPWKIVLLVFAILLLIVSLCLKPVDPNADDGDESKEKKIKKPTKKGGRKLSDKFGGKAALNEPVDEAPAEEPVAEEPVDEAPAEEPVAEEAVDEAPAEEPVAEEPVDEAPVEEPVAEEAVDEAPVEEPILEEPVEEAPAEESIVEESVEEAPAEESIVEEPVEEAPAEETIVEEPVEEAPVEESVVEEPVEEAPVEESVVEEPVEEAPAEESIVEESVEEAPAEESIVEEPVEEAPAEETIVEEPVEEAPAEETIVEEPVEEAPAEESVVEEPVEEAPVEEPAIDEATDETNKSAVSGEPSQVVMVSYRSSFLSRLIQAETDVQDYYTVIKNTLLSYKGVKARTSWNYESFNIGRLQCAKLNVKGRTLLLYLALNPADYNASKYHFVDVSGGNGKFDMVPMLLKVKSDRALKYAVELIEELMRVHGVEAGPAQNVDYHMPYETNEALAERDLVKVIVPEGVTVGENDSLVSFDVSNIISASGAEEKNDVAEEPAVEAQPAETEASVINVEIEDNLAHLREAMPDEAVVHVDAQHADELISDADAKSQIEVIEAPEAEQKLTGTKLCEINIDTICENFQEGETVELAKLIDRGLVSKNSGKVKVLARGVMTKRLVVIADKYSIQAVKMITLAGGRAEQIGK